MVPPTPDSELDGVMGPPKWFWLNKGRTREPGLKRVTRGPVATTVPAPSEPGTHGVRVANGYLPYISEMDVSSVEKVTSIREELRQGAVGRRSKRVPWG